MSRFGIGIKKTVQLLIGLLMAVVILLLTVPYFFKDDILQQIKGYANEQLESELDFENSKVELSLIWTFPDFRFSMQSITLRGKGGFEGKKLADIGRFECTINMIDVYQKVYKINSISISDADFWLKVLRNGQTNYAILKEENNSELDVDKTDKDFPKVLNDNFSLKVDNWTLDNINVVYDDLSAATALEITNLCHQGRGDFSLSVFDVFTNTQVEALTLRYHGVDYFSKTRVNIQFNALVDHQQQRCTIKDNIFRLNELELQASGTVDYKENNILDLQFSTPKTDFASFLSMVPSAYTSNFKSVNTKGSFSIKAAVKGLFNDSTFPAFKVDLTVDDAYFKYPDLDLPVQDIQAKLLINSPSSDLDKLLIDVKKLHFKIGSHPFDGQLKLQQLLSDPSIEAKVQTHLDLGALSQAFPMASVQDLSGRLEASLRTKTKMSFVNNKEYDKIEMQGALLIKNMQLKAQKLAMINLSTLNIDFSPNAAKLNLLDLRIGQSDIKVRGILDNVLGYFSKSKIMRGQLSIESKQLDLNELYTNDLSSDKQLQTDLDLDLATSVRDTTQEENYALFDRFNIDLKGDFKAVRYQDYHLQDIYTVGSFSPNYAVLEILKIRSGDMSIQAKGQLEHMSQYFWEEATLHGTLTLHADYLNFNQLMQAQDSISSSATSKLPDAQQVSADLAPLQLPDNIDFAVLTTVKKCIYDRYQFENVQAELHLHHRQLDLNALRAEAFGGTISMNGSYNSQQQDQASFDLAYDVMNLDIQLVAQKLGLTKKLLPILNSVYGKFNADMEIQGRLKEDSKLDYRTLFAKGMLKTFQTSVKNNKSLLRLARLLQIETLKEIDLGNTTNFIKFEEGRLKIEPASYQLLGMDVIAGGSHGLDKSMDYDLKMRIPRSLFSKNPAGKIVGNALGLGLKALAGQAEKIGLDLEVSEFLNLAVEIKGTVNEPKFKLKLLGGETKSGTSIVDEAANLLKEEAERLKAAAEAKAKAELERIRAAAAAKLRAEQERLKKEAAEKARKLAEAAAKNLAGLIDSSNLIDPTKVVDPSKIVDPDKIGNLFKNKDKDIKNPFGEFKNPFGPK